jgi:hypothetical protein
MDKDFHDQIIYVRLAPELKCWVAMEFGIGTWHRYTGSRTSVFAIAAPRQDATVGIEKRKRHSGRRKEKGHILKISC